VPAQVLVDAKGKVITCCIGYNYNVLPQFIKELGLHFDADYVNAHSDYFPIGSAAPECTVVDPTGKTIRLSDYKGQPLLLVLYSNYDGVDKRLARLQAVCNQLSGQSISVLAVDEWATKAKFDEWVKKYSGKYTFPVAFEDADTDPRSSIMNKFGIDVLPAEFLIDANGNIVTRTDPMHLDPITFTDDEQLLKAITDMGYHIDVDSL